jgi:hypothetical protein
MRLTAGGALVAIKHRAMNQSTKIRTSLYMQIIICIQFVIQQVIPTTAADLKMYFLNGSFSET